MLVINFYLNFSDSIHLTETEQAWIANVAESKLENPNTMVGIMIKVTSH